MPIALRVLDLVEAPGFLDRVEEVGLRLEKELAVVPCEVRRRGLFMGLKWSDEGAGILAAKACIDAGVFAIFANNDTSVMQLLPPLVLTRRRGRRAGGHARRRAHLRAT